MEFNATFLISATSFILFTLIMNKIFYKPLGIIMDERQRYINDNKTDAQNSDKRADALIKDRENKLNKSVADSKKLVTDKVNEANDNSRTLTEQAKQKSKDDINAAKEALVSQAAQSEDELNSKIQELADVISSKVLGNMERI